MVAFDFLVHLLADFFATENEQPTAQDGPSDAVRPDGNPEGGDERGG